MWAPTGSSQKPESSISPAYQATNTPFPQARRPSISDRGPDHGGVNTIDLDSVHASGTKNTVADDEGFGSARVAEGRWKLEARCLRLMCITMAVAQPAAGITHLELEDCYRAPPRQGLKNFSMAWKQALREAVLDSKLFSSRLGEMVRTAKENSISRTLKPFSSQSTL